MTARDVERIVRDIVADYGYAFDVLTAASVPGGWQVALRQLQPVAPLITRFHVEDAPPAKIHTAIRNALESSL